MRSAYRWMGPVLALTVFGTATLAGAPVTYAAEEEPTPGTVAVTGRGTVIAQYDTAQITLGVTALRETPQAAYEAMAADMNKVVEAMRAAGLKDEDLKTGTFMLNAEYDWVEKEGQKLRGYRATNTVVVTTQELDQVAALAQAAVAAGVNQLDGIRFLVKDTDAVMEQALDLAMDDAKAKATRAVERLGAKLARPIRIDVNDVGNGYMPKMVLMESAADAGRGVAPAPVFQGTQEFTVTVGVTFELQ